MMSIQHRLLSCQTESHRLLEVGTTIECQPVMTLLPQYCDLVCRVLSHVHLLNVYLAAGETM